MANPPTPGGALFLVQIAISVFLSILFLQSGIDKIADRKANLEWLTGHFSKSPLAGLVPLLLFMITVVEVAAGGFSAAGAVKLIFSRNPTLAFYGACLSAAAILFLFFGQRMAKDYPGAATLVPYFLVAIVAMLVLG